MEMIDENTIHNNVIVYGTATCPYCVMAKRYLSEKGVKYRDVDVGADQKFAMEMLMQSGQVGVPVLDIGGTIIVGFNRPAIDSALLTIRK